MLGIGHVGVDQHHVHERVEIVGRFLPFAIGLLVGGVRQQLHLAVLVRLEPGDAPLEHAGNDGDVRLPGDLQTVDDDRGRVRPTVLAEAREPAPAAVRKLHRRQGLQAVGDHAFDFVFVEDRIAFVALPAGGPLLVVADFLGVQVRPLFLDLLEVRGSSSAGSTA